MFVETVPKCQLEIGNMLFGLESIRKPCPMVQVLSCLGHNTCMTFVDGKEDRNMATYLV